VARPHALSQLLLREAQGCAVLDYQPGKLLEWGEPLLFSAVCSTRPGATAPSIL
jgi:hypothetical protein